MRGYIDMNNDVFCETFWYSFCHYKIHFSGALFKRILAWEKNIFKK